MTIEYNETVAELRVKLVAAVGRGREKRRWFPLAHGAWEPVPGAEGEAETAGSGLRAGGGRGAQPSVGHRSAGCLPGGGDRRLSEETLLSPVHSPSSFVSYLCSLLGRGEVPADQDPVCRKCTATGNESCLEEADS